MAKGDPLLILKNLKAYYPSKKGLVRAVDDVCQHFFIMF